MVNFAYHLGLFFRNDGKGKEQQLHLNTETSWRSAIFSSQAIPPGGRPCGDLFRGIAKVFVAITHDEKPVPYLLT